MIESSSEMQTVAVEFSDRKSFLDSFFSQGEIGSIFVAGFSEARPGAQVRLDLRFPNDARSFRIRGIVRWRRLSAGKKLPAGTAVELAGEERPALELILDFARGRTVAWSEREERVPAKVEIHYATGSVFLTDLTEDLSRGGLFVRTDESLAPGDAIKIKLKLPGDFFSVRVGGSVAWVRERAPRGAGIKFETENPRTLTRLERIVKELKAQIAEDFDIYEA